MFGMTRALCAAAFRVWPVGVLGVAAGLAAPIVSDTAKWWSVAGAGAGGIILFGAAIHWRRIIGGNAIRAAESSGGEWRDRAAAAERSRESLRQLLDGVPSPVFAQDSAGVCVACNRAAAEFFEGRAGGVVGRPLEDLFTQAEVLSQHAAAVRGMPGSAEVRFVTRDGVRTYQVMTTPAGGSEIAAVMTLRDVTDLAAAVQLKSDFVANASHELRTPLSSIRAAAETLADGAWDEPVMRERLVKMIASNAARLEEMVHDLLDLSRLESPEARVQPRRMRASEVARSLIETFEVSAAERRVTITIDFDSRLERMFTDPRLLILVLKNLVDNAVKFAYESTTIRVTGEVVETPPGARLGARFRVADRGIGIPLGHQQRVFERFHQVDPSRSGAAQRRGTGLGLAIVKHAVKTLGGAISVESVWKEGTTMTVDLPGVVESGAETPEAEVRPET
ncbi:two-component system, OmpR family, phosphate regulon sensor histidine kinase PhoR [Phycisphaerales bacterium]|nr:two-component system, OmpR family, phosphate regulon sensor histidine kinase PhoR [Phycisphaerales bacterium]